MNEKYILERKGEKASIYLRLFLTTIFSLGVVVGVIVQNEVPKIIGNYITGIFIYSLSIAFSLYNLSRENYNPSLKYYAIIFELIGFGIVISGYLRFETKDEIARGVRSITLYGVYFLLIAGASLRFSPRFSLIAGILTSLLFTSLSIIFFIIVKQTPGTGIGIDVAFIIVNSMFLWAMAVTTTTCTRYVRQLVEEQIESKNRANAQSENLTKIIEETKFAIKELNSVFQSMNNVVINNKELNNEQSQLMDEITNIIDKSNATTSKMLLLTSNQESVSEKNSTSLNELNIAMNEAERVNQIISLKGSDALKRAEIGEVDLKNTVQEMENIKDISSRVSHIVSVIYGIAKQTNLLALNAAIEAARAGEQGKGFAVVADEVSKLADLAGRNANQIGELVKEMNAATQKGSNRIQSVVSSIHDIVQGIRLIVSELYEMDEKVKKEMILIKEVLTQNKEMQNFSGKLKLTSGEQNSFSKDILQNIQTIHNRSKEILQTASILEDNTNLLQTITHRLTGNISS